WAGSAAYQDPALRRAAFAPREQDLARPVRDAHAPALDGHHRSDRQDGRRADEARSAGRRGCRDQGPIAERARPPPWRCVLRRASAVGPSPDGLIGPQLLPVIGRDGLSRPQLLWTERPDRAEMGCTAAESAPFVL